jgi:hypothetical protein
MLSNGRSGEARSKLDEIELADGLGEGVSLLGLFDLFCLILVFCSSAKLNSFLFKLCWNSGSSVLAIQELICGTTGSIEDSEGRIVAVVVAVAEYRTRRSKSNMDDGCNHLDSVDSLILFSKRCLMLVDK